MSELNTETSSLLESYEQRNCADAPSVRPSVRRLTASLLLILIICAIPRIWLITHTEVISRDGTVYVRMAQQWADNPHGVIQDYNYHVAYSAIISVVHQALSASGMSDDPANWDLIGQCISLIASLAALAGIWLFAALAFNWRVAWVSVLVIGLGRKYTAISSDVLTDSLSLTFQIWTVALAVITVRLLQQQNKRAIGIAALVGVCSGAGYLVRPESLLPGVLAIGMYIGVQLYKRISWRLTLSASLVTLVAMIASASPYIYAIGGLTKKKALSDIVSIPLQQCTLAIAYFTKDSGIYTLGSQFIEAIHPVGAGLVGIFLATWIGWRITRINLPLQIRITPKPAPLFFMLSVTTILGSILVSMHSHVGYISHRHIIFIAALLAPLAGAGGVILVEWMKIARRRSCLPESLDKLFLPLGVTAVAAGLFCHTLHPLHNQKLYFRQAGNYTGQIATQDDRILTYNAWAEHYAKTVNPEVKISRIIPRKLNARRLINHITQKSATILVISNSTCDLSAEVSELLKGPGFTKLRRFPQATPTTPDDIIIYRINRDALRPKR